MDKADRIGPACSPRAEFPGPGHSFVPPKQAPWARVGRTAWRLKRTVWRRPPWARVGHVLGLLPVLQCRRPSGARVDRLRHSAGYAEPQNAS